MRSRCSALLLFLGVVAACARSERHSAADGDVARGGAGAKLDAEIAQDDELRIAEREIANGHPWHATKLLVPILRDDRRRRPAALLLAARAAAGWQGWAEVDRLLAGARWLDLSFAGEGRELLARAALERGADSAALTHAIASLGPAADARTRAMRLVYLARAQDRRNVPDSAATAYAEAAQALPSARDWLALRVAGAEADSAARARNYARVVSAPAHARIPWTEAEVRERFADVAGAAARYAALGATVQALRLRLSIAPDTARRDAIKRELLTFIRANNGSADARLAVEVLDRGFTTLLPGDELVVARSIAVSGPTPRAIGGFERALREPSLVTAADRIQYAQVLTRAGRRREALAQLDAVAGPLAGQAALQRARTLLSGGGGAAARSALRDVVARFPADTSAVASALYLLADLATDDGDDAQARRWYVELYRDYPTSARAPDARFRAALLTFVDGDAKSAAARFDSIWTIAPHADDALAARYWGGRAWTMAGDPDAARARWREVIREQPTSYYSALSARRMGETPWTPLARVDSFPDVPAIDSAIARAELLERLGMDVEARFEYDALEESASASHDRLLATAAALRAHGQPSRAVRLGRKLVDAGERDARAFRLVYPLLDRDELTRQATAHDLELALVAAVIRQESSFNPRALSVAGARGLMQVLPSVGEGIARSLRFPMWYPALLFDADANLEIGATHLATTMKQYAAPIRALAAYNAGASRVARWSTRRGVADPEMFAERIPFAETRDYVRIVSRNVDFYRALYGR